jgi:hypothetical protein
MLSGFICLPNYGKYLQRNLRLRKQAKKQKKGLLRAVTALSIKPLFVPLKILTTILRPTSHARILPSGIIEHINQLLFVFRIKIQLLNSLLKLARQIH